MTRPAALAHHCHALGCTARCPPAHLMCAAHWARVPTALQHAVYASVGKRRDSVDASWAPWWRAQARAIHHVAMLEQPNAEKGRAWLEKELAFADRLERRVSA